MTASNVTKLNFPFLPSWNYVLLRNKLNFKQQMKMLYLTNMEAAVHFYREND